MISAPEIACILGLVAFVAFLHAILTAYDEPNDKDKK